MKMARRVALVALAIAVTLTGWAFGEEEQVLRLLYGGEYSSLLMENAGTTSEMGSFPPTCTEGLLSRDIYGNLVYGLADSYEVSEDGVVYTFHIREGQYWVDSKGEKRDELVAEDFVSMANWVCNPDNASDVAMLYSLVIDGAEEALAGNLEHFEGFKALDKYTLQITQLSESPYLLDLCTEYVPLPTQYYASIGADYGMEADTTWYIGCYYMSDWEPQYSQTYLKNPWYWDAEHVYIDRIEMTYNGERDQLAPELFKRGEIDVASVSADVVGEWMQDPETASLILPADTRGVASMSYFCFCFAPTFGEEYEPENYILAVDNENFRKSIYFAINRVNAKMAVAPYDAERYLSHTITPVGWSVVDGKDFTEFEGLSGVMSQKDYGFDPEAALQYRDAAIEELAQAGASFPVKLYVPYSPSSEGDLAELQIIAQQVEALLGEDYVDFQLVAGPSSGFTATIRRAGNYAFMKLYNNGNVQDPFQWAVAFMPGNTYNFLDQAVGENVAALGKTYAQMLGAGNRIMSKSPERYEAFAEAEAFLIEHALVIPYSANIFGGYYIASKLNPFERVLGIGNTYKWMHLYDAPITKEQYAAFEAEYQAGKAASSSLG